MRLSSLGDVVLTTGPLRLLKRRRPDLQLHALTRAPFAPLLASLPELDSVIIAPRERDEGAAARPRFATVLDWQGGLRGRRAARRFAPGARRIAYATAALQRRLLVVTGRRWFAPDPYVIRLARTIAGSHAKTAALESALMPHLEPPKGETAERIATALAQDLPPRGWAVLGPGASRPLKAVPESLAQAIENDLLARGFGIVRICEASGGRGVAGAAGGQLMARDKRRYELGGDIAAVMAAISRASVYVGSDSGLLHIATALRVPAVGLFGPTAPELGFSPLGRATAVGVELACRPCHVHGPRFCWLGHQRCWRDLHPDVVAAAVERLLDRTER